MSEPRKTKAPKGQPAMEFGWYDPASLDANPLNWKVHPEDQLQVVEDLIHRHNWLVPLTFNRTTGRLLNGHARRLLAIQKGWPVPVVIIEAPEESEPEILLALDPSGDMAEADTSKLADLLQRFTAPTNGIRELVSRVSVEGGVAAYLARLGGPKLKVEPTVLEGPGDGTEDDRDDTGGDDAPAPRSEPAPPPPVSHVRMVQLFLTTETFPGYQDMVTQLQERYGTANPTDTVMECLRRACDSSG